MTAISIKRIEIQGFRGIREPLVLDLVAPDGKTVPQIVVAGPNGSGKTSVLEAVLLALGRDDLLVRDLPKDLRHGHWRTAIPEGAVIRLSLLQGGKAVDIELTHATPRSTVRIDEVAYFSSWRAPMLVGAVQPLTRGKRPGDTESNRLWRLKQRIVDERAKTAFGSPPGSQDLGDTWLAKINKAWARLHGDADTRIVAGLVTPSAADAYADLFVERDGRRLCSVDEVSSGEIELLSFAGWIVLTGFTDGILLIDEPELHLHQEWQAAILPALRELAPDAQFLVATHADAPWNRAFSWERAILVPDTDPRSEARRGKQESTN